MVGNPSLGITSGKPVIRSKLAVTTRIGGEHGAETGLALRNALVGLRSFVQWVGFNYRFDFSLGYIVWAS
jgi:hypothetical protein